MVSINYHIVTSVSSIRILIVEYYHRQQIGHGVTDVRGIFFSNTSKGNYRYRLQWHR